MRTYETFSTTLYDHHCAHKRVVQAQDLINAAACGDLETVTALLKFVCVNNYLEQVCCRSTVDNKLAVVE